MYLRIKNKNVRSGVKIEDLVRAINNIYGITTKLK